MGRIERISVDFMKEEGRSSMLQYDSTRAGGDFMKEEGRSSMLQYDSTRAGGGLFDALLIEHRLITI